jgi:hypothetical protein
MCVLGQGARQGQESEACDQASMVSTNALSFSATIGLGTKVALRALVSSITSVWMFAVMIATGVLM